jgi:hypothetical protein
MADQIPTEVDDAINSSLGADAPSPQPKSKQVASYKMVGSSKIPVSKANGKVWKSRVGQALKQTEDVRNSWEEAIRYYENDQLNHRQGRDNASGNTIGNQKAKQQHHRDRERSLCQCHYYGSCIVCS